MTFAIVLAGGRSRRFGRDKASEMLAGRPLLQHVLDCVTGLADEVIVVGAVGQALPPLRTPAPRVVDDVYDGAGPLGGLYAGLAAAASDFGLVVGCDMPLLRPALLAELLRLAPGQTAVVPVTDEGPQPLCAAYARSCIDAAQRRLESKRLRLIDLLQDIEPLYLGPEVWRRFDRDGVSFLNLNRQADLQRVESLRAALTATGET